MKPSSNPLQEKVILVLPICDEECMHYIKLNLQLLHILHSLSQGQSSVPMSTAVEGLCIRNLMRCTSPQAKQKMVIEMTSSLSKKAEEHKHGGPCPSGSNHGSLGIPPTNCICFVLSAVTLQCCPIQNKMCRVGRLCLCYCFGVDVVY